MSDATWQSMTWESSRQYGSSKGPESSSPSFHIPDAAADDVVDRTRVIHFWVRWLEVGANLGFPPSGHVTVNDLHTRRFSSEDT